VCSSPPVVATTSPGMGDKERNGQPSRSAPIERAFIPSSSLHTVTQDSLGSEPSSRTNPRRRQKACRGVGVGFENGPSHPSGLRGPRCLPQSARMGPRLRTLLPGMALILLTSGCTTDPSSDETVDDATRSALRSEAADPVPATLDCLTVIDVLDTPPPDYMVALGVVAFAGSDNAGHALQAVENEQTGWFGAKTGLLVRTGSSFTLAVPSQMRDRMSIGWGASGPTWELRIPGCERVEQWLVFSGGFSVRAPECVPLTAHDGASVQQVMIGVGAPCAGQDPPLEPTDS